jgi:hypothetical protein
VVAVWTSSTGTLVFGAIDFACRSLRLFQMRGIIRVSEARRLSLPIRTPRPTDTPPTGTSRRVCTNEILGGVPPAAAEGLACRPPHPACPGWGPRHRRWSQPGPDCAANVFDHLNQAPADQKKNCRHKGRIRNRHETHLWIKGLGFGFRQSLVA